MSQVPVPYTPVNTPIVSDQEFNGAKFRTVTWKVPASTTYKAKLIYVHGFVEEINIYTEFFDNLASAGIETFMFEQRGAGHFATGKLTGKTNEFHTFNDLEHFITENKGDDGFFLGGHSMGGGIVLNYGIHGANKHLIKGIIACGPLVQVHPKSAPNVVLKTLSPIAAKLLPNMQMNTKLDYDDLTSNTKWLQYIKDTTPTFTGTLAQLYDMLSRGEKLLDQEYGTKFTPPLIIVHGEKDQINWIKASEKFYNNLPNKTDKTFHPIKDGKHSLFIEREEVYQPVLQKVVSFVDQYKNAKL